MKTCSLIVIGGGPTGLACAIEAGKAGIDCLVIEKGCVVNSLYNYPSQMIFFTTPELLEIGNLPFVCERDKPNRVEALKYYRRAADHYKLNISQYERVTEVKGSKGNFIVSTKRLSDAAELTYQASNVIIATGYYDRPNFIGIPGEDLAKVSHYYKDAHSFYNRKVAIIGGGNSAALAALDLFHHGAQVTLIHRKETLKPSIKYWILPDIENRIKSHEVRAMFNTTVTSINSTSINVVNTITREAEVLQNDFVFALTGYRIDLDFLRAAGIEIDNETLVPSHNGLTLESNVPGIYLAGVVLAGRETGKIFIENGRFHGEQIVKDLVNA